MTPTHPPSTLVPVDTEYEQPLERKHRTRSRSSAAKGILWILAILVIAIPTVKLPDTGVYLGVKTFAIELVGILLAAYIWSRGEWTWQRTWAALTAAPNLAIMAFLVWCGVSAARSEFPAYSQYEAMRYLGGSLIYFSVVYGLSLRRHLSQLVSVLLVAGALGSIMAFVNYGETVSSRIAGAFRNEQLLSGFLCILFPVVLAAAIKEEEFWRRMCAQVVTVILAAGLLVSQNRSAWAGTVLGLIILGVLLWRYGSEEGRPLIQKHQVIVPLVMIVLSGGLFFYMSRTGSAVVSRMGTLASMPEQGTLKWRRGMWDKAWRMTLKKPVYGWGIGTYRINHPLFYHPDAPFRTQRTIVEKGPNMNDNAHNSYLQVGAEMGFPGMALFFGIFAAFFGTALRAVPRLKPGLRQGILCGAIAAVAAQMVSAIGSPAWEYPECSLFLWLVLGLGMATAGVGERGRQRSELAVAGEN